MLKFLASVLDEGVINIITQLLNNSVGTLETYRIRGCMGPRLVLDILYVGEISRYCPNRSTIPRYQIVVRFIY
jgi:hypothetical protein